MNCLIWMNSTTFGLLMTMMCASSGLRIMDSNLPMRISSISHAHYLDLCLIHNYQLDSPCELRVAMKLMRACGRSLRTRHSNLECHLKNTGSAPCGLYNHPSM